MGSLNKVILIGRLGQDPEKRSTPAGHSVVNVSIATSENYTDKSGNKQEKTEWHRVVFWNKLAELVEQYLKKGSQCYVEGSLQTREWQDKDGSKRWSTEIQASSLQFLDAPSQFNAADIQNAQNNTSRPNNQNRTDFDKGQDDPIEDDIPF